MMSNPKQILFLGPHRGRLKSFLLEKKQNVLLTEMPLESSGISLNNIDFLISYGYRFIISKDIVDQFSCRAINLHCSLLPWNRGADPNLWSFLEDTPKGVTIHCVDYGIDTGSILVQREISFSSSETLRSSYEKLSFAIEELFMEKWDDICNERLIPVHQPPGGSYHRSKDIIPFSHLLTKGWETPVVELIGKGKR